MGKCSMCLMLSLSRRRRLTLDCVSPWESCDTGWLMFCLCFNGGGSSDAGGSCWDMVLFFTLRRPKNYAWSYEGISTQNVMAT
ncbi:hypothetical protein Prudu_016795 [Prunus dulcis]|uniref:Uncharacterized protein n=1 Tax=Prunus dulcis TaxID=3755 RepID=A0A4Y1RM76_PRUDU|nr:hypothetical protein Prudu_016795 [Prunus dulcis]